MNHHARLTLITGPARSGKTRLAVQWATTFPGPRAYIATAQNRDAEMAERIRRHQEERGAAFQTYEEPLALSSLLEKISGSSTIIIVDCLTLWISNVLEGWGEKAEALRQPQEDLLAVLKIPEIPVILIGNEVGWGIVPENPLARTFRDLSGRLQQEIAQLADQVILMVAGIPMIVKGKR
ncbi:MAG: bifunctional adenosylcobinamide kinase/adenosylcobinamide-phosphate guanylyltransferase [Desulfobacca sp.]|nr:bifunctional adenosylcobinamide kinase/adenosylcobinamide-phosphate guanylyltransferase [Desulfobacca sp.]